MKVKERDFPLSMPLCYSKHTPLRQPIRATIETFIIEHIWWHGSIELILWERLWEFPFKPSTLCWLIRLLDKPISNGVTSSCHYSSHPPVHLYSKICFWFIQFSTSTPSDQFPGQGWWFNSKHIPNLTLWHHQLWSWGNSRSVYLPTVLWYWLISHWRFYFK